MLKKETPKKGRSHKRSAEPKSSRNKERFLSFAGIWKDIDGDAIIEKIYKWRHEAPPSPPPGE